MMKKLSIILEIIALLFIGVMPVSAQTQTEWKGKVINVQDQSPVVGARLSLNEERSAMSGDDGTFSLSYKSKKSSAANVLTISAPGYQTRRIYLTNGKDLVIALHPEGFKQSNDLVVMPLRGSSSLIETPYSVASVLPDERHLTATTPDELLQGNVSGLNVLMSSGLPGSGSNMFLQGLGSMSATSQPLILVDGMPYENYGANSLIEGYQSNPLSAIDVKDIESITVLKDATSLYGVKGANGVILINTLKAKDATTKINAYVHAGTSLTPMTIPLLNAPQYKSYLTDLLMSSGKYTASEIQALPYIDSNKPTADQYGRYTGNVDYYRYNQQTDWQSMAYQQTLDQDYYVSVKGGDETALYALSMGYLMKDGVVAGTSYDRFHARFNSDINVSAKLKARTNMSFSYGERMLQCEGTVSNANLIYNSLAKAPFTAPYLYSEDGSISPNLEDADVFGMTNVQSTLNNSTMRNLNYRFLGSLGLNYQFGKNFSLDGMFGMHFNKDRERLYFPDEGYSYENLSNADVTNKMQHRVERWFILFGDVHAAYTRKISYDSFLKAYVGIRYQNVKFENDNAYAYNSASDDFQSLGYGVSDLRSINGSEIYWNWFATYANVDYSLLNKYFFSAVLSADYSSNYGEALKTQTILYPSLAASWLINAEDFMSGASNVDLLKLRLSGGLSGNDDIGANTGKRHYASNSFLGNYGLLIGALADTELQPERTTKFNVGLDLNMFNEGLTLSLDAYHHVVDNMLTMSTAPVYTGYAYYMSNGGSMTNIGADLNLGFRLANTKAFQWKINVLASMYKNKITQLNCGDLENTFNGATVKTSVGQPMGLFYGYETDGVYATQAAAESDGYYLLNGSIPSYFGAGDMRFVNQTEGDKLIDANDRVVIGDPNPDLFGAIHSQMKIGRLGLNMQFNYSLGNDVFNYVRYHMESMSGYNNQTLAVLNRWRYEGQETDMPKATWGDPMGNARFSDRWIEDGSYLRLKNVTLSYQFPTLFKGSSVYLTAENLFTLTRCQTMDPEFSMSSNPLCMGVSGFTSPMPKTISLGIKIGL